MSSTILEQIRAEHEDIETYERAIVSILNDKPRNHRERVLHGHKVSNLLDKVVEHSKHLKELYVDEEGSFKNETENMRGRGVFTSFYEQLKDIRSFHRKYPNTSVTHEPNMQELLHPQLVFSGEERFGRYVDLHEFYARFLNLDVFQYEIEKRAAPLSRSQRRAGETIRSRMDYLKYLTCFHEFAVIPSHEKKNHVAYRTYLEDLKKYLLDFYRRTQPLVDLDDVIEETSAKFEKEWALNRIKGWDSTTCNGTMNNQSTGSANQLFCTFCEKQFTSKGVYNGHLNGKKHKKAVASATKVSTQSTPSSKSASSAKSALSAKSASSAKEVSTLSTKDVSTNQKYSSSTMLSPEKQLAFLEVLIRRMYELLTEVVHATISYLELKQTRTHEELQAEIEEDEQGTFSDVDIDQDDFLIKDDGEDQPFYNPLNLPLGWDGKPIPYWLYKLHGLGVEFKCEICGNHSYWGRRAFDRHFQEWRHAFGMRCLQIPNTKHFHDITLIQDAIALYAKLKDQIDGENWNPLNEEEYEDSEGNVLTRKTYEDLARQGLL